MSTTEPGPNGTDSTQLLRQVNGVIWPGFRGTTAPPWLESALTNGLAGVVYFSSNIEPGSPGQLAALSAQIRAVNPQAIIGVDEEGGDVTRLESATGSHLPGAAVLGRLDDVALTEAAGAAIGRMCRQAGVNLVLAPVADVNTNPLNPVIGIRSFGADTALVSRHTAAMIQGIQRNGVGACAKHFPGHGDTVSDSHLGLPRLNLLPSQLERDHLPPFRAAVDAGVTAVMSAHIVVPGLGDAEQAELPATLNPAAGARLRALGFEGLQITDALDMAAIRASVGSGPGAVQALLAGADLLCVGNPSNPPADAPRRSGPNNTTGETTPSAAPGPTGPSDMPFPAPDPAGPYNTTAQTAPSTTPTPTYPSGSPASVQKDEAEYCEVRDALLAAVRSGELPLRVLERAAARVAGFAAWASAPFPAPGSVAPSNPEPDWVAAARRACDLRIPAGMEAPRPVGPTVYLIDIRTGHNMAAGPGRNLIASVLSESVQLHAINAAELAAGIPEGAVVVVLADSLAAGSSQLAALAQIAALAPQAICVNAGVPPLTAPPTVLLDCRGSSLVTAQAVTTLLTGG
ncbi:glycoside hydrolase family 3 N-terminal domain-containing protein [Paenarthrobacter sp. Z7-10]|uniref:glycoside hydrolase family 3 N-terminal domain-containing protein n=1 Tax=Paenarthrobacter sp. Z7-10 TaxID=2787635 RepID=UPI0022A95A20|nr:glycoside hydrolase family 3 N-terminal domain-containing protein [Paenarthrobacter sp. Z7-10]